MNTVSRRLLFWSPRAISVAFAIFLSLFALDVFNEVHGVWRTLAALMIHLVPTYIVLVVLALAWRWEWVGAVCYAGLGLWYAMGHWRRHPDWVMVIAGPLLVVAAFFLGSWLNHAELRNPGR